MKRIFEPENKVIANYDYVREFLDGENPSPVLVELDPSNACNHGCRFCLSSYIHFSEFKNTPTFSRTLLPLDVMLKIMDELSEIGTRALNFTGGGDPTVNPNLREVLYYTKENTLIKMGMFTNGALLDKFDLFDAVVDSLEWVRISVDAGTKESYDWIRQIRADDGWDKMIDNLGILIEAKTKRNSNTTIGVGFVITEDTKDDIVNFAKVFSEFDVDYCQYKTDCVNLSRWDEGYERNVELFDYIKDDLDEATKILGDKFQCKYNGIEDIKVGAEHTNHYKKCLGSQIMPCIGADGNVYVCPQLRGYKEYSYGSLYDKSFVEIWNDIVERKRIMDQIENVDVFSNCTQLCKPHMANKKIWKIYNEREKLGKYDLELYDENKLKEMEKNRVEINDWEFI